MAVPAADAALLAAQAKAGKAGVDAYTAAKAQLAKQRQSAVQQAMQEAALRGGPAAAAQSQQGVITAPYDERIASLTQGGAAFSADMAARARRLADYNVAVQGARSFIPEQAAMAVAPINARGEYEVRSIGRTSEGKVAAIDAQRRLVEAQMAAAALAAARRGGGGGGGGRGGGGGGGGGSRKVNKTELESQLFSRARSRVERTAGAVRDIVSANQQQVNRRVQPVQQGAQRAQTNYGNRARNQNVWDQSAASYIAKGIAEQQRKAAGGGTGGGGGGLFGGLFGMIGRAGQAAAVGGSPFGVAGRGAQGAGAGGVGGRNYAPLYTGRPLPQQATVQPRLVRPPSGSAISRVVGGLGLGGGPGGFSRGALGRARGQIGNLQGGIRGRMEYGGRLAMDYARQIENTRRMATEPLTTYGESGQPVLLTPEQLSMFDPFDQDAILGATNYGPLSSSADVARLIGGQPGERGIASPYASEVMRNAMVQAAQEMIEEGYDINEDDVLNAMGEAELYKPGTNLYDAQARATGQPTGEEEFDIAGDIEAERRRDESYYEGLTADERRAAERDQAALEEQQGAMSDADEADARQAWRSRYPGTPIPSGLKAAEAWDVVRSTDFQQSEQALSDIFAQRGVDFIDDDIEEAMIDVGIPAAHRRFLKELYSG